MSKVVIEVSGGVAYATSVPEGVEVEIIDHDNDINGPDWHNIDYLGTPVGGDNLRYMLPLDGWDRGTRYIKVQYDDKPFTLRKPGDTYVVPEMSIVTITVIDDIGQESDPYMFTAVRNTPPEAPCQTRTEKNAVGNERS